MDLEQAATETDPLSPRAGRALGSGAAAYVDVAQVIAAHPDLLPVKDGEKGKSSNPHYFMSARLRAGR